MISYAEMDRLRKLARPLYLELRALGIDVWITERPDKPEGYEVHAGGMRSFSPRHADSLRQRIDEHTGGLVRMMRAKWDGDLEAIRKVAYEAPHRPGTYALRRVRASGEYYASRSRSPDELAHNT